MRLTYISTDLPIFSRAAAFDHSLTSITAPFLILTGDIAAAVSPSQNPQPHVRRAL
jgi:hypothetical protein